MESSANTQSKQSPPADDNNPEQQQIRAEQVRLLYKNTRHAVLGYTAGAAVLAFIQWPVINHQIILLWLGSIGLISTARIISYCAFFHLQPPPAAIRFWEKLAAVTMIFSALSWTAAGLFLFPAGNFERQLGTIVIIIGMASGAVITYSAIRELVYIFLLAAILPLTGKLLLEGSQTTAALAITSLIYLIFLAYSAQQTYKTYLQNITLRIKSLTREAALRESEGYLRKTSELLEMIATGQPAAQIYTAIALMYENRHPGMKCSMLTLSGNKLLHGGAPSLPESYCRAVHGLENGPDVGSCGASTYTGKRVIVEDISTHPNWAPLKAVALKHGLRCCWSEPIKSASGKTIGAFGMYYGHPARPTDRELDDLVSAARLAGIVMEREQRESQLHQKNKMEAIGFMAGGIAHNFNNNLAIILGNVELAQLKRNGNEKIFTLLENAKTAVRRSRELVNQITTYSRNSTQNKQSVRLNDIIDETVALLRSTIPSTVSLSTATAAHAEPIVIEADVAQIQEVLINLCNNAVYAMREKGKLSIRLDKIELNESDMPRQYQQPPGEYARLSVTDTGCGMSPQLTEKIFDPFFTTKAMHEGTGMGLATVQGIVTQHDGIIKVTSIPAQGTLFEVFFPLAEAADETPQQEPDELVAGTERILLVDDDPMLLDIGKQFLTAAGYEVRDFTDSQNALNEFRAHAAQFDLVITDQTMPGLCGKDLIRKLRNIRTDIPTALCTGFSAQINEQEAEALGIDAFFMKPIDFPKLLATMRRILNA